MLPVRTQAVSEVSLEQLPATRCGSHGAQHDAAAPPARSRHHQVSEARLAGGVWSRDSQPDGGFLRPRRPLDPAPLAAGRGPHRRLLRERSGCRCLTPTQRSSIARATMAQRRSRTGAAVRPRRGSRPGERRLWPAGEAARAADEQRGHASRWPAGSDPDRSGQRLERVHPGCSGDHGRRMAAGRRRCRPARRGSSRRPTRGRRRSCPQAGTRR